MARLWRQPVAEANLRGFKYFQLLSPTLDRLPDAGTARDKAHNRQFFFYQYANLLPPYFFSPAITSLRGIQQACRLDKVQRLFDIRRVSLGSLSEATGIFDAEPLREIVQELAQRGLPLENGADALRGLTDVDGIILTALPKMFGICSRFPNTAPSRSTCASRSSTAFRVMRRLRPPLVPSPRSCRPRSDGVFKMSRLHAPPVRSDVSATRSANSRRLRALAADRSCSRRCPADRMLPAVPVPC